MNNIEKHQFKLFLIRNKCYQAFKYAYNHDRMNTISLRNFLNRILASDSIINAFSWMFSKQGYTFWYGIHYAWSLQLRKK